MTQPPDLNELLPAPDGSATWEWDLDHGIDRYSAAATALVLGPSHEGGVDRATWASRIHPEDAPRVKKSIERLLAGAEARWTLSYRMRAWDGTLRAIRDRGFIVRVEGRATRVLGDILEECCPERIDAERSGAMGERDRERLYRAIVDFIPQLCWSADASGWIDVYNRGWYEYTGTTPEQMEGWGWVDVHDPMDLPRLLRIWRHALATGEPWEDEFRLRRGQDGMLRWHLSRAMPLRDASGRIVRWFGTNTDVHDQKLAAQEYSRLLASEQHLRREAEAANRAKDEFLAVVSHELRTPLSVIMNSAALLRAGRPAGAQKAICERIERNARQQTKLVSDLLDISRIIAGKLKIDLEPVDLSAVVRRAVEEIHSAAVEKGLALTFAEPGADAMVRGDSARLTQIVGNLLSNAVKFTPAGKAIEVRILPGLEYHEVVVRDEGAGIEAEFLPRLFRRFSQADSSSTRKHGGLGLGLSIVRELLDLQGGQAFAHSDGPGRGSTFTVRLPRLSQTPRARPVVEPRPATPVPLTGARLLVVDDEPDVRATLAEMLLACGATVTTAGSVYEALQTFRLGPPDAIVSDIAMPKEDGYALIARIRAQPAAAGRTPVLALTAYASRADQERAIAAGFDRYLSKPAEVGRLSRSIGEMLRDRLLEGGKSA